MDSHIVMIWWSTIGIVLLGMIFRCIYRFNKKSNHFKPIEIDLNDETTSDLDDEDC